MNFGRNIWLMLALAAIAVCGALAMWFVPSVVQEFQKASEFSPYWGYAYLTIVAISGLAFLILAVWILGTLVANTRSKRAQREAQARNPSQMTADEQQQEVHARLVESRKLADDTSLPSDMRGPIRLSVDELEDKLERQTLEIVVFGTISSGKSSLLNALAGRDVFRTDPKGGTTVSRSEVPWPGADKVTLVDTPGLAEIHGQDRETLARQVARDADLVLFVVDGPLRDFEYKLLSQLADMEKRVILCLNKDDLYQARDRDLLLGQLTEQVRKLVRPEDVVTLRAQPATRVRVRVLPDGSEHEETVELEPDISALSARMMAIVDRDGRDLLLANLLLRARGVVADAKQQIQTVLDKRAQALVDRTMWQAAGAAAISPLPVLDVAVGLTISTKMVLDLARVYRQTIDLDTAGRLIGELSKNLVSILGTAAATPAVATGVASLLKSVPGVGTIAGGVLQGVVQALVTRWIGSVFIAYFRNEMREPEFGWAALARAKWQEVTKPAELAQIVKMGLAKFGKAKTEQAATDEQ